MTNPTPTPLNKCQLAILRVLLVNDEYAWSYSWIKDMIHDDLKEDYSIKELKKAMKLLRELNYVYLSRYPNEEGLLCGSGYSVRYESEFEIRDLIQKYEQN